MIPAFVNTFNRLTTTRKLCDQIADLGAKPIIIDNASDWQPLLDWYDHCPYRVVRLTENMGHHAPWRCGIMSEYDDTFYIVTDCDLDLDGIPCDALDVLKEPFGWGLGIVKSGFSLRIDDLPEWQSAVKQWESRWWRKPIMGRWYDALIDTTAAMYQRTTPQHIATKVVGVRSVRSAPPYTARHAPWYLDGDALDRENQHYYQTANASNSWKPIGRGLTAPYAMPSCRP